MSRIVIIKGDEFAAPTALSGANSVFQATLVKVHCTAAATITLVDSANTAIGNTTVSAGDHYIAKAHSDKIYLGAGSGKFSPVGFGD